MYQDFKKEQPNRIVCLGGPKHLEPMPVLGTKQDVLYFLEYSLPPSPIENSVGVLETIKTKKYTYFLKETFIGRNQPRFNDRFLERIKYKYIYIYVYQDISPNDLIKYFYEYEEEILSMSDIFSYTKWKHSIEKTKKYKLPDNLFAINL